MLGPTPPKTALVTGASGGIGGAVARLLAQQGTRVLAVGRDSARLTHLAAGCEDVIEPISCDLADDRAVQGLADHVLQSHPRLDLVVLAAGALRLGTLSALSAEDWDHMYAVNVRAGARLLGVLGSTLRSNRGHVVLISSLAVAAPRPENAAYAATKAALGAVADGFRGEHGSQVRVTTLMVGRTDTAMQRYVLELESRELDTDQMLKPQDVALAVVDAVLRPSTVELTEIRIRPNVPASW